MKPLLTVIAGPTASGKTALAVELARRAGGEIVNADSQQVYRLFDIGTAKPSAEELAAVPHHLISVVDPLEPFSAAEYQRRADAAIADIASRGRPVFVVGWHRALPAHPAARGGGGAGSGSRAPGRAGGRWRPPRAARPCTASSPRWIRRPPRSCPRRIWSASSARWRSTPRRASPPRSGAGSTASRRTATRSGCSCWSRRVSSSTRAINARTEAMFARGLVEETRELLGARVRGRGPHAQRGLRTGPGRCRRPDDAGRGHPGHGPGDASLRQAAAHLVPQGARCRARGASV